MIFYWWDDAVAFAHELARGTRMRYAVRAHRDEWIVEPVL